MQPDDVQAHVSVVLQAGDVLAQHAVHRPEDLGGAPARRVVLKGVLYRKTMEDGSSSLTALCVTCPHELCPVDLVTDPERLARMGDAKSPLFECGCHFSKFDAREDGEWLSGVAYRGLFRFRVSAAGNDAAEITHIEEEALSVV